MIDVRPFDSLGHADHGWLNARHHFSFADYHDPARTQWGLLRVWNDDQIAPKSGFPRHGHRDMEIITYVRKGAITHRDSMGNEGVTRAGDVQVMSAGGGVLHEEWNLEDEATELFQIWILPREGGGDPYWQAAAFPKGDRAGKLEVLASGRPGRNALPIRADGELLAGTLNAGDEITYDIEPGRFVYLVPATGSVTVNNVALGTRDGAAITGEPRITIKANEESEVVLVETAAA